MLVSGCARYTPMPLTTQALHSALQTPDARALRIAVSQLHHPILKPIEIDPARGFTPDEAAVVAVVVNPTLRGERDQRGIASAQLLQAGLLPNPVLTGSLDFPYDASFPDNFLAYNAGLEWEVTSLLRRDAKRKSAAWELGSVDLDIAWKEWQVAQQARTAAFDLLALQAQLEAARQADQQLDDNMKLVQRAVDRHDKTLLDLAAAQTSAQDARAAVVSLERELSQQRLVLNESIGFAPNANIVIRNQSEGEGLPSHLDPPAIGGLLDKFEDRRLDLLALKRGYQSEDQTLRAAIWAQFPRISLGLDAARDNSNIKSIGPSISIDLPVFDRNQGAIATEGATRQKLFDEYVSRVFLARSQIATAISDIRGTNAQIAAAEAAVPQLESLVRIYDAAVGQQNADVLSAYQARSALWQKRIEVVKLKQQLIENWIALELASGAYLPMVNSPATTRSLK
jgi:outer membrane protein TolC